MKVLRLPLFQVLALVWATIAAAAPASDPNQNWVEVRSAHFVVATNGTEKDGRRIAGQFEQMRGMFHASFATFRVDVSQPIYILAAKNEATMKVMRPDEWEAKGHIHHAGMYQSGEDKDYVLLQLDAEGSNPSCGLSRIYACPLTFELQRVTVVDGG
jgi:hypothetical protein